MVISAERRPVSKKKSLRPALPTQVGGILRKTDTCLKFGPVKSYRPDRDFRSRARGWASGDTAIVRVSDFITNLVDGYVERNIGSRNTDHGRGWIHVLTSSMSDAHCLSAVGNGKIPDGTTRLRMRFYHVKESLRQVPQLGCYFFYVVMEMEDEQRKPYDLLIRLTASWDDALKGFYIDGERVHPLVDKVALEVGWKAVTY